MAIISHIYEMITDSEILIILILIIFYMHLLFLKNGDNSNLLFQPFMLMKKRKATKIWASKGNLYTRH